MLSIGMPASAFNQGMFHEHGEGATEMMGTEDASDAKTKPARNSRLGIASFTLGLLALAALVAAFAIMTSDLHLPDFFDNPLLPLLFAFFSAIAGLGLGTKATKETRRKTLANVGIVLGSVVLSVIGCILLALIVGLAAMYSAR